MQNIVLSPVSPQWQNTIPSNSIWHSLTSAQTVPSEQYASYSAIIDSILASSDLNTVSAKRIRKGLQEKVNYDLSSQKVSILCSNDTSTSYCRRSRTNTLPATQQQITDLIMERFDKFQQEQEASDPATTTIPEPAPTANGNAHHQSGTLPTSHSPKRKATHDTDEDDEDPLSDVADSPPPPKKVRKVKPETETDEQIAKRMQAEINAQSARSTRGGGTKKKTAPLGASAKKKEKPAKKRKSKAKIGTDEDSDVDGESGSGSGKMEKKINGFNVHTTYLPSQPPRLRQARKLTIPLETDESF
jgi:upstream activation factor subunit UAF30